jgi:hypothetical protein
MKYSYTLQAASRKQNTIQFHVSTVLPSIFCLYSLIFYFSVFNFPAFYFNIQYSLFNISLERISYCEV